MDPIELLALMAASLRAGKAGTQSQAWATALGEAVYGLSVVLHNEAELKRQLKILLPEPEPASDLVVVRPGLVVPR